LIPILTFLQITKPATKLLSEHVQLIEASRRHNVLVYIEHHKRFDPAHPDARHEAHTLGSFNYFYSYMSQPKPQLSTFTAWAGKDSDISYYLNSHHVDVCASMVTPLGWQPTRVTASASTGIAESVGCQPGTEDTVTLLVDWTNPSLPGKVATAIYTASWSAPQRAGVHSPQHFHYVASSGEIAMDQAKRWHEFTPDPTELSSSQHFAGQITWVNPFYMRYSPDEEGNFAGQSGYGYVSFEKFIDAVTALNEERMTLEELDRRGLPTVANTVVTGAILEAGRRRLDENRVLELW
jgi:D-galacturonate reductase